MPPETCLMPQVPCTLDDAEIVATVSLVSLMWTEILQCSGTVSLEANFFDLGGDSLAMMMLLFRVKEELEVDLAPVVLMDAPTLGQFSKLIHIARSAMSSSKGVNGRDEIRSKIETASSAELE